MPCWGVRPAPTRHHLVLRKDAAGIGIELLGGVNAAGDGASGIYFGL